MTKPGLLVHACCAPCSIYVLQQVAQNYSPIIFFYNPNIHPFEEYARRRDELKEFAFTKTIPFYEAPYEPLVWFDRIAGLENEPEKGARCAVCFSLRLEKAADFAQKEQIAHLTTTLSISPHKNSKMILALGNQLASQRNLHFLLDDFKKNNGYKIACDLAKDKNFYRQNHCGCSFSKRPR